jgi:hypothetical protein
VRAGALLTPGREKYFGAETKTKTSEAENTGAQKPVLTLRRTQMKTSGKQQESRADLTKPSASGEILAGLEITSCSARRETKTKIEI